MNSRHAHLPKPSLGKRSSATGHPSSRTLDHISKLEASLAETRQRIVVALDREMEGLRSLRNELLNSTEATPEPFHEIEAVKPSLFDHVTNPAAVPVLNIIEFTAPKRGTADTSPVSEADLNPMLECASVDDLSEALAAAFQQSTD